MNRAEHLQWCKDQALEYVDQGNLQEALTSMCSDIMEHDETSGHQSTNGLGMSLWVNGHLNTPTKMTKWIEGYN